FLEKENNVMHGTQNFCPCVNGAFSAELGKDHLDEYGSKCVLIGHSERRDLGDEEFIKAKFDFAKKNGYKIVF
ncbi:triose-phosphate isomerase, partial [Campylobacter jejuni]|uniref:triose-phosphate isomerase n=1 Tax=Campylobacter jejuni TaxID=197 RepID=UPI0018F8AED7